MKWNLNYIQKNAKPSFNFEENIQFDSNLINKVTSLYGLEDIKIKGKLKYISAINQCFIEYNVSGIMKVKCAVTNEDIDYHFYDTDNISFSFVEQNNDEIIFAKGNYIDLIPYIWQLIVVNVPLKVIKEGAVLENKSGKNWNIGGNIIKEDTKENNIDPRFESLKNYFDKQ